MYYFGTSLSTAGHFFWQLRDNGLISKGLSFPKGEGIPLSEQNSWPFNPEEMPRNDTKFYFKKGTVKYYRENGYTICAIEGSCKDNRQGTKSVFFTEEECTFGELVLKINSIPIARDIIKQMPFEVKWNLNEEYTEKLNELNNK